MRVFVLAVSISLLAVNAIAQPPTAENEEKKKDPNRERLGVTIGYAGTQSGISNVVGAGVDVALHFLYRFKKPYALDTTLGAFYMGDAGAPYIARDGAVFDEASMRIIRITLAPTLELGIGEKTDIRLSAGGGVYSVSILLREAIYQLDDRDDHLGVTAAAGLVRQFTKNWSFELNAEVHKFWTSAEPGDNFYIVSEGDQDPLFYVVNVGLMLRLF